MSGRSNGARLWIAALGVVTLAIPLLMGSCAGGTGSETAGEEELAASALPPPSAPVAVSAAKASVGDVRAAGAGRWSQGAALETIGPSRFGRSLGMSAAGDELLVGNDSGGDVAVYTRQGGAWRFQGVRVELPEREGPWSREVPLLPPSPWRSAVTAVGRWGDTMAVGRAGEESVAVYELSGGSWALRATLSPWGDSAARFGTSLAVTGSRIVVGSPGDDQGAGAVYVFERDEDGRWVPEARLVHSEGRPGDELGTSVAAVDGAIAAGAPFAGRGKVIPYVVGALCLSDADCGVCEMCLIFIPPFCVHSPPGSDPGEQCPGVTTCDGAGSCDLLAHGVGCSLGAECESGHCVDGVCCDGACNGACKACNLPGSLGSCADIAYGTDPAGECPGAANCNGAGACLLNAGDACISSAQCMPGLFCADGRCCTSPCNGLCQACNLPGSSGTCTNIAANQDPASECAGADVCNGAGACVTPLGEGCTTNAQCASGFCADGVCCHEACGGACRACAASKTGGANGTCGNVAGNTDPDGECAGAADCNGAGACEVANGQPCSQGSQCQSGQCADGVCCNSGCAGTCQACTSAKTGQADGQCAPVAAGTDPDNECSGANGDACGGGAACAKSNAQPCANGTECMSGNCYDGVCCNAACNGVCKACNLAGSPGNCTDVPAGSDPANECPGAASCNGAGACALLGTGAACTSAAECAGGLCVDGTCCTSACNGPCQACNVLGFLGTCTNVPAGQDPANECAGSAVCGGSGACVKGPGQACVLGAECASGFCADGVCCNEGCTSSCRACSAAKTGLADGTCGPVAAGTDPDGECAGPADCNGDGACEAADGQACSQNSQCQSGQCVQGLCCDSACGGTCRACQSSKTGQPDGHCSFVTGGTDPDDECSGADGEVCSGAGACIKTIGATCSAGGECLSGHCYDGVCCDAACNGTCKSCNLAGSPGSCIDVPAGSDPADECSGATTCDGAGACTSLLGGQACTAGVECKSGFCADGVCCDGACAAPCTACAQAKTGWADGTCAPVAAGQDPDGECAGSAVCNGAGTCVQVAGGSCAAAAGCLSGFCVDGVCCDQACGDLCHACSAAKTGGADGACAPVTHGTDPDEECTDTDACDGAGLCKKDLGAACAAGSVCLSGLCVDGVCCDGACAGTCQSCGVAGSVGTCSPYEAGTDPESECPGAITCSGAAACGEPLADGAPCFLAAECESGHCTDGVCCESACDGLCAACVQGSTQQPNGVCAPVAFGLDPDGECDGAGVCDGAFACKPVDGAACSDGAECLSGFCVDGVCCDTACGGGDPGDCQACSALAGAPGDGVCLPVTAEAGVVCRTAAWECDGEEICDGASADCPADEPAAAGTPCDDGDVLTHHDACDGQGTCAGTTTCDDRNPCTKTDTWQADGSCAGTVVADDTPCSDGDACTVEDACQKGICTGEPAEACLPPRTKWGGGGCACRVPGGSPAPAGGAWSAIVALAGLLGLRLVRRRGRARDGTPPRGSAGAAVIAFAFVLGNPRPGLAQEIALQRFQPAFAGDRLFGVPSPYAPGDLAFHGMVMAEYARYPLLQRREDDGEPVAAVVRGQLFLHVNGTFSWRNRLAVNLDVPVAAFQSGDVAGSPRGADFGDLRIGGRGVLYGDPGGPLQLGAGAYLWVPTGTGQFVTDGTVRGLPHVVVGGRRDPLVWSVALGADLRKAQEIDGAPQGSAFYAAGGAALGIGPLRRGQIGLEANVFAAFDRPSASNIAAEMLLHGRYRFFDVVEVGFGIGPGLSPAVGTPQLRVAASIAYTPQFVDGLRDRDEDSVLDQWDACPSVLGLPSEDPKKNGCPFEAPRDTDDDGVDDREDACPTVPGVPQGDEATNGCPVDPEDEAALLAGLQNPQAGSTGDADGDGVLDDVDACPQEKGKADAGAARNGCPALVRVAGDEIVLLNELQFEPNKAALHRVTRGLLDQVAEVLLQHPEITRIELSGHTDSRGTLDHNRRLAQARAEAVKRALEQRSIAPSRLTAKSYGPTAPLATNLTPVGRQRNRRVQIKILERKPPPSPAAPASTSAAAPANSSPGN